VEEYEGALKGGRMLIEGAEEKREMGEFYMEMRGKDGTRSEERFQGNAVAEWCVCVCLYQGNV